MARIFHPTRNACGVALEIVDETCCLDSQAQRTMVDGALDIEVSMVNDDENPPARETGHNRRMLYIL